MNEATTSQRVRAREMAAVLCVAAVFLAVMLSTMGRLSRPWWDEVQGAEVAANLLAGKGFTSAATLAQPRDDRFATSTPLFHLLVFGWLKLFGFSPLAVRSFGYLLAAGTALTVWAAVVRHRMIQQPGHRVLLVTLILCGLSLGRVYLNNRYDAPGVALSALLFLASSISAPAIRRTCLFAGSLLLPCFGLHLAPFGGMMALLGLWLGGRSFWKDFAVIVVGLAAGLAGVFLYLYAFGLLAAFGRAARFDVQALEGRYSPLSMVLDGILRFQRNDVTLLAAAMGLCLLAPAVRRRASLRSPLTMGVVLAVAIPLGMTVAGRYSCMYVWMAFLPVAICSVAALEHELAESRLGRGVMLATICLACLVGVPAKVAISATEWQARDVIRLDAFLTPYIRPDDRVYCTFTAYYPVKRLAGDVWTGCGWHAMSADEKSSLSLLIVEPRKSGEGLLPQGPAAETALAALPGRWNLVDRYVTRRGRVSEWLWPRSSSPAPLDEDIFHLLIYRKAIP